jgi:hypothetical protein
MSRVEKLAEFLADKYIEAQSRRKQASCRAEDLLPLPDKTAQYPAGMDPRLLTPEVQQQMQDYYRQQMEAGSVPVFSQEPKPLPDPGAKFNNPPELPPAKEINSILWPDAWKPVALGVGTPVSTVLWNRGERAYQQWRQRQQMLSPNHRNYLAQIYGGADNIPPEARFIGEQLSRRAAEGNRQASAFLKKYQKSRQAPVPGSLQAVRTMQDLNDLLPDAGAKQQFQKLNPLVRTGPRVLVQSHGNTLAALNKTVRQAKPQNFMSRIGLATGRGVRSSLGRGALAGLATAGALWGIPKLYNYFKGNGEAANHVQNR